MSNCIKMHLTTIISNNDIPRTLLCKRIQYVHIFCLFFYISTIFIFISYYWYLKKIRKTNILRYQYLKELLTSKYKELNGILEYFPHLPIKAFEINRIYHRSPMQTEKSEVEGKRIMQKRGLPSFPHYPLTLELGFSGLHRRLMTVYFLTYY